MNSDRTLPGDWFAGRVPANVVLAPDAYLETTYSFQLFQSRVPQAIEIGNGSSIYLGVMFDLGEEARIKIGDYVLMNGVRIICDSEIIIGDYSLISWNVVMMDTPRLSLGPTQRRAELKRVCESRSSGIQPSGVTARPIHIGANVWIGFDCCILPGVSIGDGAVVGARSVVNSDVPPFTVVAGNPARIIRQLQPSEIPPHA
jgi:acetyltransferase-like isoleucine patch superfamily enzyme